MADINDDNFNETDTESSTSLDDGINEPCNICNMDIPKAYIPEHVESVIHKTNVKITKLALKRSKDHLDNFKKWKPCVIHPTETYCDVCNVVYDYSQYMLHDDTLEHKKNAIYQTILPKMYQLYKDCDNNLHVINEIESVFMKYEPISTEEGKTYCDICKVYKNTSGFNGHLRGQKHKKNCMNQNQPIPVVKKNKKEKYCDVCCVFKSENGFDAHLKSKKHIKKLNKLNKNDASDDVIDNDFLKIKSLTEGHTKYITDMYGLKRCLVCNSTIDDFEESITNHLESKEHLLEYKKILLNFNIAKLGKDYFCTSCDEIFSNAVEHVREKHRSIYFKQTYCEVCKVKVPENGYGIHEAGAKHRANEKQLLKGSIKIININIDESVDKKMLKYRNGMIDCIICDESFENSISINNHFDGNEHVLKLNKFIQEHYVELEGSKYQCEICHVDFEKHDLLDHVKTLSHTWRQTAKRNLPTQLS